MYSPSAYIVFILCRSDIDPDIPAHEPNARRLFEAMLIALQEVNEH